MRATNPVGRPSRSGQAGTVAHAVTGTVAGTVTRAVTGTVAGTVAGAMAALLLTGCTTTPPHRADPTTSAPLPTRTSPTTAPADTADARTPPQLPEAEKVFIRAGGRTGPHAFPEIPRIPPGTLEVAVVCAGSGTLDVQVGPVVRYTVVCADGDPGQLNETVLGRAHANVTVSVTPRTSGTWALSVGWTKAQASST